jgi:hypothetical protein
VGPRNGSGSIDERRGLSTAIVVIERSDDSLYLHLDAELSQALAADHVLDTFPDVNEAAQRVPSAACGLPGRAIRE